MPTNRPADLRNLATAVGPRPYLRTSEMARAIGVHPNTIRRYEEWGFLPRIPRTPGGYRMFTEEHLQQVQLVRVALCGSYPGGRQLMVDVVQLAASGDLGGALEQAYVYLARVRVEWVRAVTAVELLDRWASGTAADATAKRLHIRDAAKLLGVTRDRLRNWERNGLIRVPRDERNRYRLYGAAEIGRLRIIRMLQRAGYSLMAILRMLLHLDRGQAGNLSQLLDTPSPEEDVRSAADSWLSTLKESERLTKRIIEQLENMIRCQQP